jgi:uroporphyrinogen III methyltransferase/synthase
MKRKPGRVYLIGAGPGDPGLISVRARDVLERCDVVVYDSLVNEALVRPLPSRIRRIFMGKRGGMPSYSQNEINRTIVREALAGRSVARLKGGDPFVFGRGSEEIEYLRAQAVPCEIVPGVSSALAAPASAGIPLTHRALSRSVAIATGRLMAGEDPDALCMPVADTVVVLMAVENLARVVAGLLASPRFTKATPAALIQDGTLPQQRTVIGTLGTIVRLRDKHHVRAPAVLVAGEVVRFAKRRAGRKKLPLDGARVVVLRAPGQSGDLVRLLAEKGAEVVPFPILRIRPRARVLRKLTARYLRDFTAVVLTSPNGADLFMKALLSNGADARALGGKKVFALGEGSAAVLQHHGVVPDGVPGKFVAEGLLGIMPADLSHEKILVPRASHAREILPETLRARGAAVTVLPLYDTVKAAARACPVRPGDFVLFTSSSTVEFFFSDARRAGLKIVPCCIGEVTAAALRTRRRGPVHVAKNATMKDLVATVVKAAARGRRKGRAP